MTDVIVVGGGPAGVTAALRARELGASVVLIESGRLGGTCTNDGCAPTRVLAKAARLMRDSKQLGDYGLKAPEPELDFAHLMKRTQKTVYAIHQKKQLISTLTQAGVELLSEVGPASFIDPYTLALEDGRKFSGDKIILCAGGHNRRLDFPGAEFSLIHSDVWGLKEPPSSITIVGGAATGCQLASIFEAFGVQVTILERASRILRIEDQSISQVIHGSFKQRGIRVITGIENIDRIEKRKQDLQLFYTINGESKTVKSQAVILSAGWVGNLDSLNLEAAGVERSGPYIQVDDYMRTNVPHIFAAGDINGRMMLVQSAGHEAVVASENAILGVGQFQKHQLVPHGGFTDPEYGSVGLTEEQARAIEDPVMATIPFSDLDRAVIDDRKLGLCKLIVSRDNHRILGAHVIGEQALEIVHVVAAGMVSDMWVEQLAEMEIAYPTFTAILGLAARRIVSELGVRPLAQEWRLLGSPQLAEWEQTNV